MFHGFPVLFNVLVTVKEFVAIAGMFAKEGDHVTGAISKTIDLRAVTGGNNEHSVTAQLLVIKYQMANLGFTQAKLLTYINAGTAMIYTHQKEISKLAYLEMFHNTMQKYPIKKFANTPEGINYIPNRRKYLFRNILIKLNFIFAKPSCRSGIC
tara:strand:- start:12159 stop:12620 length:462 start_codon:yes stop_codon:yes gene_type:complete